MMMLVDWSIKASAIFLMALLAVRLLRSRTAALRHWILFTSLLCAGLIPVLHPLIPALNVRVRERAPDAITVESVQQMSVQSAASMGTAPPALAIQEEESAGLTVAPSTGERELSQQSRASVVAPLSRRAEPLNIAGIARNVWATGAALIVVFLFGGLARLAWISSISEPVTEASWRTTAATISRDYRLGHPPRLLRSPSASMMATWGSLRPEIFLPSGSADWSEEQIHVVLSHELAHVQRGDWLAQVLGRLICSIFWFNPLVWVVCRRLDQESEQACDDAVLRSGIQATDYAAHLLKLARTLHAARPAWTPSLMMAHKSTLQRRFRAMLNPQIERHPVTRFAVCASATAFFALTLPVVALRVSTEASALLPASATPWHSQNSIAAAAPASMTTPEMSGAGLLQSVKGIVGGTVFRAGTNVPLEGAQVALMKPAGGDARFPVLWAPPAFTDSQGKFLLTGVDPGRYQIQAAAPGFVRSSAEEIVEVGPSGLHDLAIRLQPAGNISGAVYSTGGAPLAGITVSLIQRVYDASGKRTIQIVSTVRTNDAGEYRFYWLTPGQYLIHAGPISSSVFDRALPNIVPGSYGGAFYPSTADPTKASPIDLRPGTDVTAINVLLGPAQTYQIRGTVKTQTGEPLPSYVPFSVIPKFSSPSDRAQNGGVSREGTFEVQGVRPGIYWVQAYVPAEILGSNSARNLPSGISPRGGPSAFASVEILDRDMDLELMLSPGVSLDGQVVLESHASSPTLSLEGVRLALTPAVDEAMPTAFEVYGTSDAAGTFALERILPGKYRLTIGSIPTSVYVKEARLGETDLLNDTIDIGPSSEGTLRVVLGIRPAQIKGTLTNSEQKTVPGGRVVLVPEKRRDWPELILTSVTDDKGQFNFVGVAPGNYKLIGWTEIEANSYFDPDVLRRADSLAQSITVRESANVTVGLKALPAGAAQ